MKNNDLIDIEFEKELKNKMSSLSSEVNCFDKISEKISPERDTDYETVVSDVENVTGRFIISPVMKIVALAAAFVACIAFIPRTTAFKSFISNNNAYNKKFSSLVSEISNEIETNTYKVYDMALIDYFKYDIMYNPLCRCPFRLNDDAGSRVRLFIRTFNDVPTNQMYAVEYSGEYNEHNFIAVAETDVKFTTEELEELDFSDSGIVAYSVEEALRKLELEDLIEDNFYSDRYGEVTGENGTQLTVASFIYDNIYKVTGFVKRSPSQVVYFKNYDGTEYYYDIKGENEYEVEWVCSMFADGSSALPIDEDNCCSVFKKIVLNSIEKDVYLEKMKFGYYEPYNSIESIAPDDGLNTFIFGFREDNKFVTPISKECKSSMKIFIPNFNFMLFSSQSDPSIRITIDETGNSFRIHNVDLKGHDMIHLQRYYAGNNESDINP